MCILSPSGNVRYIDETFKVVVEGLPTLAGVAFWVPTSIEPSPRKSTVSCGGADPHEELGAVVRSENNGTPMASMEGSAGSLVPGAVLRRFEQHFRMKVQGHVRRTKQNPIKRSIGIKRSNPTTHPAIIPGFLGLLCMYFQRSDNGAIAVELTPDSGLACHLELARGWKWTN